MEKDDRIQNKSPQDVPLNPILSDFVIQLDQLCGKQKPARFKHLPPNRVRQIVDSIYIFDDHGKKFAFTDGLDGFRKFGPGVYLMFTFLRHMIILFGIACILALPMFIMLMDSPYYKDSTGVVRLGLMRLTLASLQPHHFEYHLFMDIMITSIFFIGFIIWDQREEKEVEKCMEISRLPSYLTVVIRNIPQNYSQAQLKLGFEKQLNVRVHEVYTARNFGEVLKHYRVLTEEAIKLRIMKDLYKENEGEKVARSQLAKEVLKFKTMYCKIRTEPLSQKEYKPHKVYMVLKSYRERDIVLRECREYNIAALMKDRCGKAIDKGQAEETEEGGVKLDVRRDFSVSACEVEPEAIVWQNIGISLREYLGRALVVFLIVGVFACFGCMLIFLLEILETASIGDAYYFSEESERKGFSAEDCLKKAEGLAGASMKPECKKLRPDYLKLCLLIILSPMTIFVCKKGVMEILSRLVHFRKYVSEVSRISSQIMILSIFYFLVSAALHLCLYLKAESAHGPLSIYEALYPIISRLFRITDFSPASIHLYSDFSLDWYKQATFFIVIIGSTSFNIANGFKFVMGFISYRIQKYRALRSVNQYEARKHLKGLDLHFEAIYASCIAIAYFVYLYRGCIPVVLFFGFVNMVVLFCLTKLAFIKYGNRPLRIGHSISHLVTRIMMIGLVIHCVITPIFLGAPGIADNRQAYISKQLKESAGEKHGGIPISKRFQTYGILYLILASLILVYILAGRTIFSFIYLKYQHVRVKWFGRAEVNEEDQEKKKHYDQYYGLYPSFSMHNDEKYSEILKNMLIINHKQAHRYTCALRPNAHFIDDNSDEDRYSTIQELVSVCEQYCEDIAIEEGKSSKKYCEIAAQVNQLRAHIQLTLYGSSSSDSSCKKRGSLGLTEEDLMFGQQEDIGQQEKVMAPLETSSGLRAGGMDQHIESPH